MHIAIIAPEAIPVPPLKGGSVEICILAVARELAKYHDITVYSRMHHAYPRKQQEGGVTFVRVQGGGDSSEYIGRVLKAMKGTAYDCIQIDNRPRFVTRVKRAFPGIPVALFLHSLTFVSPHKIGLNRAAACLGHADLIIANSESLRTKLDKRFPSMRHKIKKVYLGVDTDRFRPPLPGERRKLRRRYKLAGTFSVAFAGRMIPRKGVHVLLQAIRQVRRTHPRTKLLLAGGNGMKAYRERIKRMAAAMDIPVTDMGYVPHARMHGVYRMADCFVCPSQKHEAFGLVNVEAMASGIPVIGSSLGGIREIIRHRHNGYLVDSYRNPAAFAFVIRRLIRAPMLARTIGRRARQDALSRFSWENTAKQLAALYHITRKG